MALYKHADWLAEYARLDGHGDPEPCRSCGRAGFYGPRGQRPSASGYRACKFCGFWQRVGEEAFVAIPTVHSCGNGRTIIGAAQIWWEVPEQAMFDCRWCPARGLRVTDWRVATPRDDNEHPWRAVPQGRSQDEYREFWAAHEPWLLRELHFGYL